MRVNLSSHWVGHPDRDRLTPSIIETVKTKAPKTQKKLDLKLLATEVRKIKLYQDERGNVKELFEYLRNNKKGRKLGFDFSLLNFMDPCTNSIIALSKAAMLPFNANDSVARSVGHLLPKHTAQLKQIVLFIDAYPEHEYAKGLMEVEHYLVLQLKEQARIDKSVNWAIKYILGK